MLRTTVFIGENASRDKLYLSFRAGDRISFHQRENAKWPLYDASWSPVMKTCDERNRRKLPLLWGLYL